MTEINNRFAKKEEIRRKVESMQCKNAHFSAGGIPVYSDKETVQMITSDRHTLIMGASGSMKSRRVVMPTAVNLIKAGESMIINDPKGEICKKISNILEQYHYKKIVINFRDPGVGNRWNPFSTVAEAKNEGNIDLSNQYIRDIAKSIYGELARVTNDSFWTNTACDYFTGLAQINRDYAPSESLTLENISHIHHMGKGKISSSTYLKEFSVEHLDALSETYANLMGTIDAPNETKSSLYSVFTQPLALYNQENIKDLMSTSDFNFSQIGQEKTAVFMITPDERSSYNPIISMFIKLCYSVLIHTAHRNHNDRLPVRVNFLIDEFSNLPAIEDFDNMISAARSRNIRFQLVVQGMTQMQMKYGESTTKNIMNNCDLVIMRSRDQDLHAYISLICGQKELPYTHDKRQLITSMDIQTLDKASGEVFILMQGLHPFKTILPDIDEYQYNLTFGNKTIFKRRAPLQRVIFDIRDIVKADRQKKTYSFL